MSGLVKGVKKVFKAVVPIKAVANVVKKFVKSKVFKVVAIAALAYFGGAAIMSMAGGGTASAGIGSAWGGLQGAGSALMSGNVGGAFSALGSGFTGGAAAGASGTFAAGQAAAQSAIAGNAAAATTVAGGAVQATTPSASTSFLNGGSLANSFTPAADIAAKTAAVTNTAPAASTGLLAGLGDATKAAMVTSGVNMAGQMIQGYSQQKQAEEQAANRDYYGVNGKGQKTTLPGVGLLDPSNIMPQNPVPQLQPLKSLDDLIAKQQQTVNTYQKWSV